MRRKWTEGKAVDCLKDRGAEIIGKTIIINGDLRGLTGGAALDYLKNSCGYKSAIKGGLR
jgi:hypothetical protein